MAFKTYDPTKADLMRAFIAQCRAEGKNVRPVDIQAEMEKKGITISSGQASVVLRKFNKRRRGGATSPRNGAKVSKNGSSVCPPKKNNASLILAAQFIMAAQFAKTCGGIAQAKKMLGELEQIVDPLIQS